MKQLNVGRPYWNGVRVRYEDETRVKEVKLVDKIDASLFAKP
jgi:hypothetical protein